MRYTGQSGLLGIGLAVVALAMVFLAVAPSGSTYADAIGQRRVAGPSPATGAGLPVNDDFKFRPAFAFGGTGGGGCTGDLDGDDQIGFSDLLAVLSLWGDCQGCPEDIDGDGMVGFSDLLFILSNWGPCP